MKAKWLIEHFDDRNSTQHLIEEVKRQGYELETITYEPFQSGSLNVFNDLDCVVTQTSIDLALQVASDKKGWVPGNWLNIPNYKCSHYYSFIGKYIFNDQYIILPRTELKRNIEKVYNWLGKENSIFLRPDSGMKSFTGKVFEKKNFDKDWFWVEEFTDPNSLILASTPKNIKFEWRFVIADKNVITGSLYNVSGKFESYRSYPRGAFDLAQEIADTYQPDIMFVIDICQGSDNEFYVLEIGSFSCAGLYSCNMETIVKHASYYAEKEYKDYFNLK